MSDAILLPYHQDERLAGGSITLPVGVEPLVVDPDLPEADQWQRLVALYDAFADRVAGKVDEGPVRTVTGDCLAAVGTLVGLQRGGLDPSIVWFDAHGDVHTMESSESGYLGGLSLRLALGGDPTLLAEPLGLEPLAEERALLVDARDLDPAEERYLAGSRVTRTTVAEISLGSLPDGPVLVHVDVDVIDASELPGLRFPASGGPTRARVFAAVERLVGSGRVVGLDVACPWRDTDDENIARRRAEVVASFLTLAP